MLVFFLDVARDASIVYSTLPPNAPPRAQGKAGRYLDEERPCRECFGRIQDSGSGGCSVDHPGWVVGRYIVEHASYTWAGTIVMYGF